MASGVHKRITRWTQSAVINAPQFEVHDRAPSGQLSSNVTARAPRWSRVGGTATGHRNSTKRSGDRQSRDNRVPKVSKPQQQAALSSATPQQPGVAGYKRSAHTNKHTHPNTPARSDGAQPRPQPKHTHPHRTPQPGVAGSKRSAHTNTHTHPNTRARSGGAQPKPEPKHTNPHRTPRPGMAGYRRSAHTTTHAPKPRPGMVGCKTKPKPNRTHNKPQQGMAGRNRNPYPSTHTLDPSQDWQGYRETQKQTEAPHNGRKPSVHSPGTEAAHAMRMTRPNESWTQGVRLHPKACAALGLEAERATPTPLGTSVPKKCMHALGTGYARRSGEPLGFRPKEGACAGTGAHPPGETSTSRWRRSALPVLPGAALLGATSQV